MYIIHCLGTIKTGATASFSHITLSKCSYVGPPSSTNGLHKRRTKPIPILCRLRRKPARDKMIGFGRHKGRMMGTLPSTYLRWMAKDPVELPDGEWAEMAKEVLLDPYYRDRMEWETVDNPMQNTRYNKRSQKEENNYDFLRLATRFGWDLTVPWKVDYQLLGTSKGGRIPRTKDNPNPNLRHDYYLQDKAIIGSLARILAPGNKKDGNLVSEKSEEKGEDYDGDRAEVLKRRDVRRERQRASGVGSMTPQLEQRPKDGPFFPGRGAMLRKLAEVEGQAEANTPQWPKM